MKRVEEFKELKVGDWVCVKGKYGWEWIDVLVERDGDGFKTKWYGVKDGEVVGSCDGYFSEFSVEHYECFKLSKREVEKWKLKIGVYEL